MDIVTIDVLVIGAGSTVATILSQAGLKVLIAEKDSYPKYKVGESLLPSALKDYI